MILPSGNSKDRASSSPLSDLDKSKVLAIRPAHVGQNRKTETNTVETEMSLRSPNGSSVLRHFFKFEIARCQDEAFSWRIMRPRDLKASNAAAGTPLLPEGATKHTSPGSYNDRGNSRANQLEKISRSKVTCRSDSLLLGSLRQWFCYSKAWDVGPCDVSFKQGNTHTVQVAPPAATTRNAMSYFCTDRPSPSWLALSDSFVAHPALQPKWSSTNQILLSYKCIIIIIICRYEIVKWK